MRKPFPFRLNFAIMNSPIRDAGNPFQDSGFLLIDWSRAMEILNMHDLLAHLSTLSSYLPAILIMLGVATLVCCAVGCCCSPCEEKDDLFHREVY